MIKQRLVIPTDCFWFYTWNVYSPCHISPFLETCSPPTGEAILTTEVTKLQRQISNWFPNSALLATRTHWLTLTPTSLTWSCIYSHFYMHTVPGQETELQSTELVRPLGRQQGRALDLQPTTSCSRYLRPCAPNPAWPWDTQTTGISETCTNLPSPLQRKAPTVWTIFPMVQKDQSCRVPFFSYNFSFEYFSSGLYFNCNLTHFSSGVKNHLLIPQPRWHYWKRGTSTAVAWNNSIHKSDTTEMEMKA